MYTHLNTSKKKFQENTVEKDEITHMSNFTYFHKVYYATCILTLYQRTNFRLFQNERVCRRQFQNWMKVAKSFPNGLENTVGKGEIAHYEQFHLFPQCFQKSCTADTLKQGLVWASINTHISVVICSFFEFGTVTKWCTREWVKINQHSCTINNGAYNPQWYLQSTMVLTINNGTYNQRWYLQSTMVLTIHNGTYNQRWYLQSTMVLTRFYPQSIHFHNNGTKIKSKVPGDSFHIQNCEICIQVVIYHTGDSSFFKAIPYNHKRILTDFPFIYHHHQLPMWAMPLTGIQLY